MTYSLKKGNSLTKPIKLSVLVVAQEKYKLLLTILRLNTNSL